MTALQPGYYAVPDPDDQQRMTYWVVGADGKARDFPSGVRWRPLPPRSIPKGPQRQDWYDNEYRAWLAWRDADIAADPAGASARFRARYPDPGAVLPVRPPQAARKAPKKPVRSTATDRVVRDSQGLIVAALRAAGHSYRAISESLGVPLTTVHRRAEHGRLLTEVAKRDPVDQLADALRRLELFGADGGDALRQVVRLLSHGHKGAAAVSRAADSREVGRIVPPHGGQRNTDGLNPVGPGSDG